MRCIDRMAKDKIPSNLNEDKKFDSFIDSIEEEIRNENWQRLWEKYGKFATYGVCAIILAVGGYNMWQKQDLKDREAISARYVEIQNLAAIGNVSEAMEQFKALSTVSQTDYATLAKFEYAALLRSKKDLAAIAEYKAMSEDPKVNVLIRDLAYVFYVLTCLDIMPAKDLMLSIDGFIRS
ncbi:MAG: tetratricopeptide repeat protein, partial [Holosporales bacterium]|nr:tetratricopeptide repeat protein [Holosporales bacterium]